MNCIHCCAKKLGQFTPKQREAISAVADKIGGLANLLHPGLNMPDANDIDGMPRTQIEKYAINVALHNNVPVLGLCGGFQKALHNFGTRFEHLETEIYPTLKTSRPYPLHVGPEISVYDRLGGRNIARTKSTIYNAPLLKPAAITAVNGEARTFLGDGVKTLQTWAEHKWGTTEADIRKAMETCDDPLAKQIQILAKSPDGVVDMVGIKDKFLGIQRHPEMGQDPNDYRFFEWIANQAKARAATKTYDTPDLTDIIHKSVGRDYDDSRWFVENSLKHLNLTRGLGLKFVEHPCAQTPLKDWLAQSRDVGTSRSA